MGAAIYYSYLLRVSEAALQLHEQIHVPFRFIEERQFNRRWRPPLKVHEYKREDKGVKKEKVCTRVCFFGFLLKIIYF